MSREFPKTIRFRATARAERQLEEVAKLFALKPSQVLRQLVAEAHARHFPAKKAAAVKVPVRPEDY
jgi:hypothetical protein